MKNLVKFKVIFLAFAIILSSQSYADDRILPVSKPAIDEKTLIKTSKKKNLYPEKKPKKIEEKKQVAESNEVTSSVQEEENIYIYPEKKPTVVQKKVDKAVTKSSILSKRDFKIAKSAFEYISNKKWIAALNISKKASDKTVYNLINYLLATYVYSRHLNLHHQQ